MAHKTKPQAAPQPAAPAEPELKHFWMVVGGVNFKNANGEPAGVVANVLTSTPETKFNHHAFDGVHREFARRVLEEHGVNPNDITAITIHNICYLGEMTLDEMFGPRPAEVPNEQAKPAH